MFIPVSIKPLSQEPLVSSGDTHISLETVSQFYTRFRGGPVTVEYVVVAAPGVTNYYVTKETYDLLKSLVLQA